MFVMITGNGFINGCDPLMIIASFTVGYQVLFPARQTGSGRCGP